MHARCWVLKIACCLLAALLISVPISWLRETLIILDDVFLELLPSAFTTIVSSRCKALGKEGPMQYAHLHGCRWQAQ